MLTTAKVCLNSCMKFGNSVICVLVLLKSSVLHLYLGNIRKLYP